MKAILLALLSRLRFVFGRDRLGDETSEELKLHHELLTARYIDTGMSRDDARDAATRQLGNVTRVREDIHDMNSVRWLDVLRSRRSLCLPNGGEDPRLRGRRHCNDGLGDRGQHGDPQRRSTGSCSSRCPTSNPSRSTVSRSSCPSAATRFRASRQRFRRSGMATSPDDLFRDQRAEAVGSQHHG